MIRVGVTENRILANVYCQNEMLLHVAGAGADDGERSAHQRNPLFQILFVSRSTRLQDDAELGGPTGEGEGRPGYGGKEKRKTIGCTRVTANIFGLQENALMEKGADYTVRLRQLHQQVMVLRGAAFNGVMGFSLCLFGWCGQVRCQKPRSALRWVLAVVPRIYLL